MTNQKDSIQETAVKSEGVDESSKTSTSQESNRTGGEGGEEGGGVDNAPILDFAELADSIIKVKNFPNDFKREVEKMRGELKEEIMKECLANFVKFAKTQNKQAIKEAKPVEQESKKYNPADFLPDIFSNK